MDERILTETFDKITKQYTAIKDILNSAEKPNRENLSIEVYSKSEQSSANSDSDNADKKQRMMMRVKHIERYLTFLTNHIDKVSTTISDIPPYNVSLEIVEDACDTSSDDRTDDWDKITEEVYNTLSIESDDEDDIPEIDPSNFFDDDDPPLKEDTDIIEDIPNTCDSKGTPECSDDEELEVSEIEIDKVKYYTTDERSGKIYHILANDEIGKKVGIFNEGVATFY